MPWFRATCEGFRCNFERNFEAEDIIEARDMAEVDHQTYSPLCTTSEDVQTSSIEKEIYDMDKQFLGPLFKPVVFREDHED